MMTDLFFWPIVVISDCILYSRNCVIEDCYLFTTKNLGSASKALPTAKRFSLRHPVVLHRDAGASMQLLGERIVWCNGIND